MPSIIIRPSRHCSLARIRPASATRAWSWAANATLIIVEEKSGSKEHRKNQRPSGILGLTASRRSIPSQLAWPCHSGVRSLKHSTHTPSRRSSLTHQSPIITNGNSKFWCTSILSSSSFQAFIHSAHHGCVELSKVSVSDAHRLQVRRSHQKFQFCSRTD